ncbi:MAG: HAMP domain-containing histidine kinase [Deltaproteobacteria bacterium]|nr:HAMP domain-containing histidine kinase [Deltaproteobacteria bacterium]
MTGADLDNTDGSGSQRILVGRYRQMDAVNKAREALLGRREFSLRLQISLGFFLVFLIAVAIGTALLVTIYQIENKLIFLEIVNDYVIEIQQARRFEKNFFLYGTNLSDALENVYTAKDILERNANELIKIQGKDVQDTILTNISHYEEILERLASLEEAKDKTLDYLIQKKEMELGLRDQGQKMISYAQDMMASERDSVTRVILKARSIHIFSFICLLIFMALNAYLLGSQILGHIRRFADHSKRIAMGDFTPIMPSRRFRNEFTDLALAINYMMQELESRETVLIQSHKMRAVGTLTAGIAHELNNPLNNITLTAHMLLEDFDNLSVDERKEMMSDVVSEADRAKDIIRNLLDFARESSSQMETLDLEKLLKDTIHLASNQIKLTRMKIRFQTVGHLCHIHGDGQQLRQVFLNLILNAIDASPNEGEIQILLLPADEPGYAAVKVIDFGSGIPDHVLGSIFDPFFTTKSKGKGTGLGLSVSQGIIAKHGGRIQVSSTEGKGTTFTVILPVTPIAMKIDNE